MPGTVQIALSSVKPCLSLSQVDCLCAILNETLLLSLPKVCIIKSKISCLFRDFGLLPQFK
jgi:hypothetical protein